MLNEKELINKIEKSGYNYELFKHKALFTVEESIKFRDNIKGLHSKNLFLKNKKNEFFLFSCLENTKINLKEISKSLKIGNLSFAKENYLKECLGVIPGSVTPFGLLNDIENKVIFFCDSKFLKNQIVNFHPLTNTSTIGMKIEDFINFLIENKKKVNIYDFTNYSLIES
tara:strand:- start:192 stop:701 length:510 start_codon:yes stop_codon:yes gene_type:complete